MKLKNLVFLVFVVCSQSLNAAAAGEDRRNLLPDSYWINQLKFNAAVNLNRFRELVTSKEIGDVRAELIDRQKSKKPEEIVNDLASRYCTREELVDEGLVARLVVIYRSLEQVGLIGNEDNPAKLFDDLVCKLDLQRRIKLGLLRVDTSPVLPTSLSFFG